MRSFFVRRWSPSPYPPLGTGASLLRQCRRASSGAGRVSFTKLTPRLSARTSESQGAASRGQRLAPLSPLSPATVDVGPQVGSATRNENEDMIRHDVSDSLGLDRAGSAAASPTPRPPRPLMSAIAAADARRAAMTAEQRRVAAALQETWAAQPGFLDASTPGATDAVAVAVVATRIHTEAVTAPQRPNVRIGSGGGAGGTGGTGLEGRGTGSGAALALLLEAAATVPVQSRALWDWLDRRRPAHLVKQVQEGAPVPTDVDLLGMLALELTAPTGDDEVYISGPHSSLVGHPAVLPHGEGEPSTAASPATTALSGGLVVSPGALRAPTQSVKETPPHEQALAEAEAILAEGINATARIFSGLRKRPTFGDMSGGSMPAATIPDVETMRRIRDVRSRHGAFVRHFQTALDSFQSECAIVAANRHTPSAAIPPVEISRPLLSLAATLTRAHQLQRQLHACMCAGAAAGNVFRGDVAWPTLWLEVALVQVLYREGVAVGIVRALYEAMVDRDPAWAPLSVVFQRAVQGDPYTLARAVAQVPDPAPHIELLFRHLIFAPAAHGPAADAPLVGLAEFVRLVLAGCEAAGALLTRDERLYDTSVVRLHMSPPAERARTLAHRRLISVLCDAGTTLIWAEVQRGAAGAATMHAARTTLRPLVRALFRSIAAQREVDPSALYALLCAALRGLGLSATDADARPALFRHSSFCGAEAQAVPTRWAERRAKAAQMTQSLNFGDVAGDGGVENFVAGGSSLAGAPPGHGRLSPLPEEARTYAAALSVRAADHSDDDPASTAPRSFAPNGGSSVSARMLRVMLARPDCRELTQANCGLDRAVAMALRLSRFGPPDTLRVDRAWDASADTTTQPGSSKVATGSAPLPLPVSVTSIDPRLAHEYRSQCMKALTALGRRLEQEAAAAVSATGADETVVCLPAVGIDPPPGVLEWHTAVAPQLADLHAASEGAESSSREWWQAAAGRASRRTERVGSERVSWRAAMRMLAALGEIEPPHLAQAMLGACDVGAWSVALAVFTQGHHPQRVPQPLAATLAMQLGHFAVGASASWAAATAIVAEQIEHRRANQHMMRHLFALLESTSPAQVLTMFDQVREVALNDSDVDRAFWMSGMPLRIAAGAAIDSGSWVKAIRVLAMTADPRARGHDVAPRFFARFLPLIRADPHRRCWAALNSYCGVMCRNGYFSPAQAAACYLAAAAATGDVALTMRVIASCRNEKLLTAIDPKPRSPTSERALQATGPCGAGEYLVEMMLHSRRRVGAFPLFPLVVLPTLEEAALRTVTGKSHVVVTPSAFGGGTSSSTRAAAASLADLSDAKLARPSVPSGAAVWDEVAAEAAVPGTPDAPLAMPTDPEAIAKHNAKLLEGTDLAWVQPRKLVHASDPRNVAWSGFTSPAPRPGYRRSGGGSAAEQRR